MGTDAMAQSHYATKQAQESYDNGIKLEKRADEKGDKSYLKEAEAEYRSAIKAEPNMVQAYIRLGYVLYSLNRSAEGVDILQDALQRHPDDVELKHYLGLSLYQAGKAQDAEAILTSVIESRQDLPEAYFILGKISLDKGDSLKAQEYFSQYASILPNDIHAYRALASAYIQAKDVIGAESALSKIIELDPKDNVAKINMGHVKYERGQIDEAVKLYEQAYKNEPKRHELLYTIASAYYLSGRYEEAIKRFNTVLEHDSTHMSAEYFKADSELKLGHLDEAEKQFLALQEKMPDYRYIKLKLAYIRMMRGDPDAAKEIRALMKESTNPDDRHFGAVMLRKQGNVDESIAIHESLRNEHPEDSIYGVYLAREILEANRYADAADILMTLIDESVSNTLAWEMLSMTLLKQGEDAMMLGEFEQARGFFEQALSMEVHTIQAHCSLSQLSLLEGKNDVAFESYQAAEMISADDPNVIRLAAQFDIIDNAYDAAVKRLENLRSTQSDEALGGAGWYILAVAQSNLGNWEDAEKSLEAAEKEGVVDSPALAIVALHGALEAYRNKDIPKLTEKVARIDKYQEGLDDTDLIRFSYLKSFIDIRDKKFAEARTALEKMLETYNALPDETRHTITQSGDLDISFELAYVYYEMGNLDAALSTLVRDGSKEAVALEAAILRKLGYRALRHRKYDAAIQYYNRLNTLGVSSTPDQYNFVLAKFKTGQLADPDSVLEQYARQNIPEAVLNYAIYLDKTDDGAKATKYYEKYVAMTSSRKSEDVRRMLATKQRVWGSH